MYSLGLDIGSSSVKAALVEVKSGKSILSVHEPKNGRRRAGRQRCV